MYIVRRPDRCTPLPVIYTLDIYHEAYFTRKGGYLHVHRLESAAQLGLQGLLHGAVKRREHGAVQRQHPAEAAQA